MSDIVLAEIRDLLLDILIVLEGSAGVSTTRAKTGDGAAAALPPFPEALARYCAEHPNGSVFPCRLCAEARERFAAWSLGEAPAGEEVDHSLRGYVSASSLRTQELRVESLSEALGRVELSALRRFGVRDSRGRVWQVRAQ